MKASVPDSKDSMGMVALSVSMSAISSPALTRSPTFLFHLMTVPSVIVSESWGMVISKGMGLQIQRFALRTLRLYAGRWPREGREDSGKRFAERTLGTERLATGDHA